MVTDLHADRAAGLIWRVQVDKKMGNVHFLSGMKISNSQTG